VEFVNLTLGLTSCSFDSRCIVLGLGRHRDGQALAYLHAFPPSIYAHRHDRQGTTGSGVRLYNLFSFHV